MNPAGNAWQQIAQATGVGTSHTFSFDTAQNTTIFTNMAQAGSRSSLVRIETFSGSTSLGYNDYQGTLNNAPASTVSIPDFNIGTSPTVTVSRSNSAFTHDVWVVFGSFTSVKKTGVGTSVVLDNLTASSMYAQIPNATSGIGSVVCTTKYNGVVVRADTTDGFTAFVTGSEPTFTATNFTYTDTNTAVTALTTSDQHFVQGKSTMRVTISTQATIKNSATFSKYIISIDGVDKELTTTTGYVDMGVINAGVNQTLKVIAVDSRGLRTEVPVVVTVFAYSPPTIATTLTRANKFENTTTVKISGSYSDVSGLNNIKSVKYRYQVKGAGSTWVVDWTTKTETENTTANTYSITDFTENLTNTNAYYFEFEVIDQFGTVVVSNEVGTGSPILFIDSTKKSVGVGKFPVGSNSFETIGGADFGGAVDIHRATGGQALRLIQDDYTSGGGAYNYIGFADDTGAWKAYIGFGSSRDGTMLMYNTLGDIKLYPSGSIEMGRKVFSNVGGQSLELKASTADHVYMALFADSQAQTTRSGYFGFGSAGSANMSLVNEMSGGNLIFQTAGSKFTFNKLVEVTGNFTATGKVKGLGVDGTGVESQFSNGTYTDPRSGVSQAIKASGGMATDYLYIKDASIVNGNDLTFSFPNGQYMILAQGVGGTIFRGHQTRIVWSDQSPVLRVESWNGGSANLIVATVNGSSDRELKKNIEKWEGTALKEIVTTPVYKYHFKDEEDFDLPHIGLVMQEAPLEVVDPRGEGVDLYAMIALSWKAIQELSEELNLTKKMLYNQSQSQSR